MKAHKRWRAVLSLLGIVAVLGGGSAFLTWPFWGDPIPLLEKGKKPAGAKARLAKRAIKNPNDLRVQTWLIRLEIEEGDLEAAEKRLTMLERKAPGEYATLSGACFLYLKKEEAEAAIPYCEQALLLGNRSFEDLSYLAFACLKAKEVERALILLRELKDKYPRDARALNNLGYGYLMQKNMNAAIPLFEEAIQRDPRLLSARKNLARAWYESQQYKNAVQELKALLKVAPGDQDTLVNLAFIYAHNLYDLPEARKWAELALQNEKDPRRRADMEGILKSKSSPLSPTTQPRKK